MECWKRMEEKHGPYSISDRGNIRLEIDRRNGRKGKRIASSLARGYRKVGLTAEGGVQRCYILSRLIGLYWVENPDPEHLTEIDHKDGNKLNNSLDNLEWVSRKENAARAAAMGLYKCGEENPNSRLTDRQADEIYKRVHAGENQRALAKEFGIGQTMVSRIKLGQRKGASQK